MADAGDPPQIRQIIGSPLPNAGVVNYDVIRRCVFQVAKQCHAFVDQLKVMSRRSANADVIVSFAEQIQTIDRMGGAPRLDRLHLIGDQLMGRQLRNVDRKKGRIPFEKSALQFGMGGAIIP